MPWATARGRLARRPWHFLRDGRSRIPATHTLSLPMEGDNSWQVTSERRITASSRMPSVSAHDLPKNRVMILTRRPNTTGPWFSVLMLCILLRIPTSDSFQTVVTEGPDYPRSKCRLSLTTSVSPTQAWQVYVDQSKVSLDKGGSATLDAFMGLAPKEQVQVLPALLPKTIKTRGPTVRCIHEPTGQAFDVGYVDSVDKVHRILTKHMKLSGVNATVCECLKWKFRGNSHLEEGKIALAIDAYDKALACGVPMQEGPIRIMRASAFSQSAAGHKQKLKETLTSLTEIVPESATLETALRELESRPAMLNSLLRRIQQVSDQQRSLHRRTQYYHGMYQFALLAATQDALAATERLPTYAGAWLKAGETLSDLWKLKESTQHYERALELDPSLATKITPIIERLGKQQEFLESARGYGSSEGALRLALDATG